MGYLNTTVDVYKQAAEQADIGLCCTSSPLWQFPGLKVPKIMQEMNYGCGSTVNPKDLVANPKILYVGVGGGMEILQFAYFSRQKKGVTGIDIVPEMLDKCRENLAIAETENKWFHQDFINLQAGSALALPVADQSMDIAAQNCLFNIFKEQDLNKALKEMYRVLKPNGRLIMSDPICETEIPDHLKTDERLRALCLSGAIPLDEYIKLLSNIGFGTIEVRARRPYRILDSAHYEVEKPIYIESIEICAIKDPVPEDGSCVFTGKTAIYIGNEDYFDDGRGHVMQYNQPLAICDKTANALKNLHRKDIFISASNWHYDGGGCC